MSAEQKAAVVKKRILVVDDQAEMRKSISRILKIAGYDFIEASDGKVALHLLGTEHVDMIISDIRMPEMHGIELLHNVRRSYSIPFIMMTGFSEIIETTEAYEIGVDGFLLKPFKQQDLLTSIKEAFEDRQRKQEKIRVTKLNNISDQYCGIPVGEFISGKEIKFPIFLKLSEEKFIRIAFCGEDLSTDKIETLKGKGVKFLYLQRDDFKAYISFASKLSNLIVNSAAIDTSKKAKFLRHSSTIILEYGFQQKVDKEIFELARLNVEQSLSLLVDDSQILSILDTLTSHEVPLYSHCMGVALVASLIAKALGWQSSPLFFRVVSGGIFHDIGKKNFSSELLNKSLEQMTAEEVKIMQSHPTLGAEMLSEIEGMPSEIPQIVLHHHELCDGSGYPTGLGSSRIHPVAKVIACADEFCKWYRGAPGYGRGIEPGAAIMEMEKRNTTPDTSIVRWENLPALKKVFGI